MREELNFMSEAMSAAAFEREREVLLTLVSSGGDADPAHVLCPDPACSNLAVIEDRWSFGSTSGAFGMAKVRCSAGCWYTVPEDDLRAA
jgi:hypothetical protein